MNKIFHYVLTIDCDIWEPHKAQSIKEIDELLHKLKTRALLGSCGNVKTRIEEK